MAVDTITFDMIGAVFLFAFGACIGSFLNVVAYRVPLGKSVISPPSSCPHCGMPISAIGLVPIFGYFFVGRRCHHCKISVSIRYPAVEFLTASLTVFVVFRFVQPSEVLFRLTGYGSAALPIIGPMRLEPVVALFTALWILYTGIALSLIDLDHRILPDVITLPGTLVGFLLGSLNRTVEWDGSIAGILVGAGCLFAIAKAYELTRKREGLGLGDVKYLGFIGAVVGWQGVIWVIAIASFIGAIVGVTLAIWQRKSLTLAIPFGPFLALGAFIVIMWGGELRNWLYPPLTM